MGTCANKLHHFDAATMADSDGGHVMLINGVVERVVAAMVVPAVAFEAIYGPSSWKRKAPKLLFTSVLLFSLL